MFGFINFVLVQQRPRMTKQQLHTEIHLSHRTLVITQINFSTFIQQPVSPQRLQMPPLFGNFTPCKALLLSIEATHSMQLQTLEAFFTHGETPCGDDGTVSADASHTTIELESILYVHGPVHAGQTSLLLQYGFTQAKKEQDVVLVMCGDGKTEKPVFVPITSCAKCGFPTQTGMDNQVWRRIQIKYLQTNAELQHFLCSFHLVQNRSSVLLIDGFDRFFPSGSHKGNVYQTLAFLYETLLFMKQNAPTANAQAVVTGITESFVLENRYALRRWCRFIQITPDLSVNAEFLLQEERDQHVDHEKEDVEDMNQMRYEYAPPDAHNDGIFRLLDVRHNCR